MTIAVDAGALCTSSDKRFGNYWVSRCFLEELVLQKNSDVCLYGFKPLEHDENVKVQDHYKQLSPSWLWNKLRVPFEQLLHPTDYFLSLNQAIPSYVSGKVISFSHGLAAHFFPQMYPEAQVKLERQLQTMMLRSERIIVSSRKVEKEIRLLDPQAKVSTIPFGVPKDMVGPVPPAYNHAHPYLLFVGMDHPIKRIDFLYTVYEKAKKRCPDLEFVLVGPHQRYKDMAGITVLESCERSRLRRLYRGARALVTASHYESFNLPVLEALANGCTVIGMNSAIIPELESFVHVSDSDEEFVTAVEKVLSDNLKHVAESEQIKIFKKFTWKSYVDQFMPLL